MKAFPHSLLFGGDYNPGQWPEEIWDDDYDAFDLAHINTLTINVFSWASLEPAEGVYDFTQLDDIVDRLEAGHRNMVLATSTGAMPPWLAQSHPDVLRTDFEGRRHGYGQRHNACPNSPAFRERSAALAGRLASRYGSRAHLIAWHIGNEYGGACYCDNCAAEFRTWLQEKYGTLDRLNQAWNSVFWSHTFSAWDQILPPNALTEHWRGEDHTAFQGITLDYRRFMSDSLLACFVNEKRAIRRFDSTTPVTTNFMGLFRPLDYFRWAEHLDFASWDNYPPDMNSEVRMALTHDLNRGLKGGKPFWVMEQTPSRTASRDVNPVKRPGVMRLWSWQAVAHGADAVLFFQMRASRGACEKYHGAVLDHSGHTDTRTFTEVADLGAEFEALGPLTIGARTPARVALIWDWDSWWAWEMTDGINRHLKYIDVALNYYRAWWKLGVDVDVVPMDADLAGYEVVIAPLAHMAKADLVERLDAVAERGGTVITGMLSCRVDPSDNAILDSCGTPLARLAGVRIEEIDAAEPGQPVGVQFSDGLRTTGTLVMEIMEIMDSTQAGDAVGGGSRASGMGMAYGAWTAPTQAGDAATHAGDAANVTRSTRDAEVVAIYTDQFYTGTPAVTRRRLGEGELYYIATLLDDPGMDLIARTVADHHGLTGPYPDHPDIEVTTRVSGDAHLTFVLNHADTPVTLPAPLACRDVLTGTDFILGAPMLLHPKGVRVLLQSP